MKLGALALVVQLIIFQNTISGIPDLNISGPTEAVLSGVLLAVAIICLCSGLYFRMAVTSDK